MESKQPQHFYLFSTFFIKSIRNYSKEKHIDRDLFRNVLTNIGKELGVKEYEDWYKIRILDVKGKGGSPVLRAYKDSISAALYDIFPEHKWKFWKFEKSPVGSWSSKENQREFLDDLYRKLNMKSFDEWYTVRSEVIEEHGGRALIKKYHSVPTILMNVYPNYDWKPWLFVPPIKEYWHDQANQRKFFNDLARKIGIEHWTDWYSLSPASILEHGGSSLLVYFRYSVVKAIMSAFPEYEWDKSKFQDIIQNQKKFFDALAKRFNIEKYEDWYSVKWSDYRSELRPILSHYDNSILKALQVVYPQYEWKPWKFDRVWQGFWDSKPNQVLFSLFLDNSLKRAFLDDVYKQLGLTHWTDWYAVKQEEIETRGGHSVLDHNNYSISSALMSLYPEYKWEIWKFETVPKGYWDDLDKVREGIEWAGKRLGVKNLDDWYRVTLDQMERLGFYTLIRHHGGLIPLLSKIYPLHKWFAKTELPQYGKTQQLLLSIFKQLFPTTDVHFEYPHPDMLYPNTQKNMQLDIFVPAFALAVEYQGEQHYQDNHVFSHDSLKARDVLKREKCQEKGITLIGIPYWWSGDRESIVSTILKTRPELQQVMKIDPEEGKTSPLQTFNLMKALPIQ